MKALTRRLSRLEAMREHLGDLVDRDQLQRMAAIVLDNPLDAKLRVEAERVLVRPLVETEAERARVREQLLGDGPHEPVEEHPEVESDARRILRQKLLRDDAPPTAEPARA